MCNIGLFLILLIIMLSDLHSPKSKRNKVGVNKSNTTVSLPGITNNMKNCRTDHKANNQSYIQTINNISENIEYSDKNTLYLTNQQSKLKEMLKKMNNDTLHMIDLIKPKKYVIKTSKEQMATIADRQIDNSKKNISIMQAQIEKLESKYNKIVEQELWEELTNKIREIKLDIEAIKNGNVGIKYNIGKDGKEIIKDYSEGYDAKLTILENDTSLYNQKLEKLKNENSRVMEEANKIQLKLKEADGKIQLHDQQYQKIRNAQISLTSNRNIEITLRQKKYQLQAIKKKAEFQNNHNRYKYYKLLKQLEAKKTAFEELSSREDEILKNINISKEEIIRYQSLNEKLKKQKLEKNRSVLLFLEKQRKNKAQINQLKQSMISEDLFASRQQLNVRAISLRQPTQSKTQQFEQTRKWHKQVHSELAPEQYKETVSHKQENQIQKNNLIDKNQQDIDHSTAQLKKKQLLQVKNQQNKMKIQDNKNPEIIHVQQNFQ